MKLASANEMRRLDRAAMEEYGIPGIVLMENAGRAVCEAVCRLPGELAGRRVLVVAGPGMNGGDGCVVARHLAQRGALPSLLFLSDPEAFAGDAATNFRIVRRLGLPLRVATDEEALRQAATLFADCNCVVDALFGTGLTRQVEGRYARVIGMINSAGVPVVACDIPSGLDADSGRVLGCAVRADRTVTFGLAKPGLVSSPGRELVGALEVADIGLPAAAVDQAGIDCELLGPELRKLLPARPDSAHKGAGGHLLVAAGGPGTSGAALLVARGALRIGAGLVSLLAPRELLPIYATALPECMTVPLAGAPAFLAVEDRTAISKAMQGKKALVLGPGIGTDPATADLVCALYRDAPLPMVVDADALNILARTPERLRQAAAPRILTPHPGEMARLCGKSVQEIQQDRLALARDFAAGHGIYLVLKCAATVLAAPGKSTAINPSGNPAMATGGSGDVLAGVIGGLLAQGLAPWPAACLGVYLHGLAGDLLAARRGAGFFAGELADALPETRKRPIEVDKQQQQTEKQ